MYSYFNNYNRKLKRHYGDFYDECCDEITVRQKYLCKGGTKNYAEEAMINYLDWKLNRSKKKEIFMDSEKKKFIRRSVSKLPDIERNIILLHYWFNFNMNEISKHLNLSLQEIITSHTSAISRLRELCLHKIFINEANNSKEVLYA